MLMAVGVLGVACVRRVLRVRCVPGIRRVLSVLPVHCIRGVLPGCCRSLRVVRARAYSSRTAGYGDVDCGEQCAEQPESDRTDHGGWK